MAIMTKLMDTAMYNEGRFKDLLMIEHDSCGIICIIEKDGHPSRGNVQKTINALVKMEHRSGFIDGEGDGCGILTDIPRALWRHRLEEAKLDGRLVDDEKFFVAHIFVPRKLTISAEQIQAGIRELFNQFETNILLELENQVDSNVLGPNARNDEPVFWQIAGLCMKQEAVAADHLFELHIAIEEHFNVHVASLNQKTAAYKVMGSASILPLYFHDTQHPLFAAQVTIGHNRYSTNTLSNFFRVQPFSLLGHNGEINTIKKMRYEADMIGVPLVDGGSDSQDMNRTIETLIHRFGFSLFEAMELVFPPIINEMKLFRPELQDLYVYYRQIWGHYAQGPAAIVSRYGDECVFSVDALGLRPLWMVESEDSLYFSSEQGIITVDEMVAEPKSTAPGEKIGVVLKSGQPVQVVAYPELQTTVLNRAMKRVDFTGMRKHLGFAAPELSSEAEVNRDIEMTDAIYSAFGWDREGIQMIESMSQTGAEPIRSLGYDGPLAALHWERQNIADYIKESVAVVTNPAIDRDREMEHFSTRIVVGPRPSIYGPVDQRLRLELPTPLLLEGKNGADSAKELNQPSLEQLLAKFREHNASSVAVLPLSYAGGTSLVQALDQLAAQTIQAVQDGAVIVVLDDRSVIEEGRLWMDAHLAVSKIDIALKSVKLGLGGNLRREASIVLRSASIRNLHDIALACGVGADLISPYALFATAALKEGPSAARKAFTALQKGLEKVISTIGTHELRGYTRFFSSIGLHPEVAKVLDIVNYLGSETAGTRFADLEQSAADRQADLSNPKAKAAKNFHFFQRMWKSAVDAASGAAPYSDYMDKLREEEKRNPVSIRHVADFNFAKAQAERKKLDPSEVDISVGEHSLPILISSMSFGSQNETAFRAYAEAGKLLNMVTMNGEGGEIKDMLGRYKKTRGAQIASGRFGVNVELANAVAFLEIKIGQGAKPGEGGHLPGSKVTAKIAAARNATIGSDLISPSNNHDIYSIEDLAQFISELKEASGRQAKIIVKAPVVPGIGTIAVGIAKAGANVITLSGFDGGTGAARIHSLQHVGLPTEIGTKLAHIALIEAGLRDKVEIWSDGGMKSGADVVKMMMLGANRCGFGSMSMQAIGCTTCRGCHLDTCHVGIATQIDTIEEADERGLRRFVPRVMDSSVAGLVRLFGAMGEEIRSIAAELGFAHAQELVGRSDLLQQVAFQEKIDLSDILRPAPLQFNALQTHKKVNISTSDIMEIAAGTEGQEWFPSTLSFDAPVERRWSKVAAESRILGTRFSSHRVRDRFDGSYDSLPKVSLNLADGSVPGNGLAAFNARGVDITVHGGAEDGVAKMSLGGKVAILKSPSKNKQFINGSVGKSFGYGSQKGLFLIQGNADSRACIRLSGADVVFGGEITAPLRDELGSIASRANLKGFAFEYMTNGRAVVMGDPGPWICAGMTGGIIYQRLVPEMGLDTAAIKRRIAKGAKVNIFPLEEKSKQDLTELLGAYVAELHNSGQHDAAAKVESLMGNLDANFVRIAPVTMQADQSIATE